jgi:hypothetical protein
MVLRYGQADLGIGLEPAILVHEHNVWGLKRVLEWQQDLAVVQTLVKVGVRRTLDGEVPRVKVVLEGFGGEVG